jgi:hypothetical protein
MSRSIGHLTLVVALLWTAAPTLHGQVGPHAEFMDHDALTATIRGLVSNHSELVALESLVTSREGRDVWLLTLGNTAGRDTSERPSLLVVANIEANRVAGSAATLRIANHLLEGYGTDPELTRLLDERTLYLIPRLNPDGAERYWTMPAYELPFGPHPDAPERAGLNVREIGEDLTGSGRVQLMRVEHPDGSLIEDPDEPRLLREADRARAERGQYKLMVEGIHPDSVDAYFPMGSDGVNLNRNFPHEYLYYRPHVGPHQVSEPETRALADFVFERVNISAVFSFTAHDNLRSAPPQSRQAPDGVAPGPPTIPDNVLADDRPYFEFVSEQFRELTGLDGDGEEGEAGSFPQFAYFQVGIPSFTTPLWTLGAEGDGSRDHRWLALFDEAGIDGFTPWTPASHPILGAVEVGGFLPNARVNPPPGELDELASSHARFLAWLGNQLPELEVVETSIEPRGEGVWMIEVTIRNDEYLPTHLAMGERVRTNRPITARLLPHDALTVLSGDIQQQLERLDGMGARHTFEWLVTAPAGTELTMELFAERAGGLQATTLNLR